MQSVQVAGAELHLLPERAVYFPAHRSLLVADAHFGKGASFRALGVPVPGGTTRENLARLSALIDRHAAEHVVFLGDFLHSRHGRTPATLAALGAWRSQHAAVRMTLIRGNHDDRAGDPPPVLQVEVVDEPYRLGPFALCHHPQTVSDGYVLAGHLHPAVRVAGRIDAVRLPCFWLGGDRAVLPAFGAFTGACVVMPEPEDRVYAIVDEHVFPLPMPVGRAA